jgi:hypothetical protein
MEPVQVKFFRFYECMLKLVQLLKKSCQYYLMLLTPPFLENYKALILPSFLMIFRQFNM